MDTIGNRVKSAREKKKWNQEQLASAVNITKQAIQKLESGRTKRGRFLPDIAKALNVDVDWLMYGRAPTYTPYNNNPLDNKDNNNLDNNNLYKLIEVLSSRLMAVEDRLKYLETTNKNY